MAISVGELMAYLDADDRGFSRGLDGADARMRGFQRDAEGRLHDLQGRFVKEGEASGRGFSGGLQRHLGGLPNILGAVSRAGGAAFGWSRSVITAMAAAGGLVHVLAVVPGLISAAGGAAALLPAAALAGAVAINALKIAMSGFSDAIGAGLSGDMDKFNESIKGWEPGAQATARAIVGLRGRVTELREKVRGAVFGGLADEVQALGQNLLPMLQATLTRTGQVWNTAFSEVGALAASPAFVQTLGAAIGNVNEALRPIAGALAPILQMLLDIAAVGSEFLPGLTSGFNDAAQRASEFVSHARETGQLQQWISGGLGVLGQIGQVLGQVGGIISAVFSAASASGGGFASTLTTVLQQVNAFLSSGDGQATLQAVFTALSNVAGTIGPLIGQALAIVGPILATLITQIAGVVQQLGPVISGVLSAIGPVLISLAPIFGQILQALLPFVSAMGGLLAVVAPLLVPIAQLISQLVSGLVPILTPIITLVGQVAVQLGGFLVRALSILLPPIMQVIQILMAAFVPILGTLMGALMQLLEALMPLLPPLGQLIVAIAPIIALVAQLAAAVITALVPVLVPLIALIAKLAAWLIGLLAKALTMLIDKGLRPVINVLTQFVGKLGEVLSAVTRWVAGVLSKVGELPGKIKSIFMGANDWLVDAGRRIIDGLIDGIKAMIGKLKDQLGKVTDLIPSWKGPEDRDRRLLTPAGTAIMGGLMGGIAASLPALRRQLGGVTAMVAGTSLALTGPTAGGFASAPMRPADGGHTVVQVVVAGKVVEDATLRVLKGSPRQVALANRAGTKQLSYADRAR